MNNQKRIGSTTELRVMLAFIELGYSVSSPYGDCERYDFIADIDGRLLKVQCKTARSSPNGNGFVIDVRRLRTSIIGYIRETYGPGEVDFFATCYEGRTYLIPAEECGTQKTLCTGERSGQLRAEEYEIGAVLERIRRGEL